MRERHGFVFGRHRHVGPRISQTAVVADGLTDTLRQTVALLWGGGGGNARSEQYRE